MNTQPVIGRLDALVHDFNCRTRLFTEDLTPGRARMFVMQHRLNSRHRNSVLKLRVATNCPDWDLRLDIIGACSQEIIADHEHGGGRPHWEILETLGTHIGLTRHHLGCRCIDSLQARSAKTIELLAGYGFRVVGIQCRRARNIGALFANRRHTAEYYIIHKCGIELISVTQGAQYLAGQVGGRYAVQGAVGLATAPRGANMVVDIGCSHFNSSLAVLRSTGARCFVGNLYRQPGDRFPG